jgi:hypothetical protein
MKLERLPMAYGRKTGGRQKGSLNRKNQAIIERAQAEGIMPLEVMLKTMRELWDAEKRIEACAVAEKAAPYVHARLSTIDQTVSGHLGYTAVPTSERDPVDATARTAEPSDPEASYH